MSQTQVYLYEGMFLFDLSQIGTDVSAAIDTVNEILRRADAEVIAVAKWDDRRLAYDIKGQKRGIYIIAHFKARGTQIANIERDVNLSDKLLRCMILRAEEFLGEVELEEARTRAAQTQDAIALAAQNATTEQEQEQADEPVEVAADTDQDDSDDVDSDD